MTPDAPSYRINGVPHDRIIPTKPTAPYNHWDPLHSERNPTPEWFARWEAQIPDLGCACRKGYAEIRKTWRPDFSSAEAFFASTVKLHNLVNAKLGKRIVSLEEAYSIWRGNNAGSEDSQTEGGGGSVQAVSGSSDA